jgi:hypothetical protein
LKVNAEAILDREKGDKYAESESQSLVAVSSYAPLQLSLNLGFQTSIHSAHIPYPENIQEAFAPMIPDRGLIWHHWPCFSHTVIHNIVFVATSISSPHVCIPIFQVTGRAFHVVFICDAVLFI